MCVGYVDVYFDGNYDECFDEYINGYFDGCFDGCLDPSICVLISLLEWSAIYTVGRGFYDVGCAL